MFILRHHYYIPNEAKIEMSNNVFSNISSQLEMSKGISIMITINNNDYPLKWPMLKIDSNRFTNITSWYNIDFIYISWTYIRPDLIDNNSLILNSTRITDKSSYDQILNSESIFSNNVFERVTFYIYMILIYGYEVTQIISNEFNNIGFFSESIVRSIFPFMDTPISTCTEYNTDILEMSKASNTVRNCYLQMLHLNKFN